MLITGCGFNLNKLYYMQYIHKGDNTMELNILAVGDVVSPSGIKYLQRTLP